MSAFRHVVAFRWKLETSPDQIDAVTAALRALPAAIPELVRYEVGPDAGVNEGNFDYVVVADFASVEDYLVYRDHPAHRAAITEHIAHHVAERAAVQYAL